MKRDGFLLYGDLLFYLSDELRQLFFTFLFRFGVYIPGHVLSVNDRE